MALPASGPISGSQIATELGILTGPYSLHNMSLSASFSTPDAMSDFYSYSAAFQLNISCDGTTNALACTLGMACTAYTNVITPVFGTVFYSNNTLTTLYDFSGYSNIFIKFDSFDNVTGTYKARIDNISSAINNSPQSC
jgi:hypothetical protein